jgi:hypothetical protein
MHPTIRCSGLSRYQYEFAQAQKTNKNHPTTEIFTLLGCYAAQIGSQLSTFRDNQSVPSSMVVTDVSEQTISPIFKGQIFTLEDETDVPNYQSTPRHVPEEPRYDLHRGGSLK